MLGKLLKYEFRATGRVFLLLYGLLLVMSVVARFVYSTGEEWAIGSTLITVVITLIMVMLFTAVWVVTLVLILRRFWQNLLGREGYLMNVLPVSSWEHVGAKLITATVWVILSGIISVAALFIIVGGFEELDLPELWETLGDLRYRLDRKGILGQLDLLSVLALLGILFGTMMAVLQTYASMCLGQLVNKHRVLLSVGAWFGISIARSILVSRLMIGRIQGYIRIGGDTFDVSPELADTLVAVNKELLIFLLFTLICCAVLYFVSGYIMKKRLNLQ